MEFTYYNPVKLFHGENKLQDVVSEIKALRSCEGNLNYYPAAFSLEEGHSFCHFFSILTKGA